MEHLHAEPSSTPMVGGYQLAIKLNRLAWGWQDCGVCGELLGVESGAGLYMADSYTPVCFDCGRNYAPDLVKLLLAGVECGVL